MKHRIRTLFSLLITVSMLLSLIPFTAAAFDDEFEGFETLEEIPFEFELEPGDLPYEQLKDAVLAAEDIPACIDPALIEARGHVNRLYLQEPDDCTVMFQNRDGSKTIYVFSHPVKGMTASATATIRVNGGKISFAGSNIITSRIGTDLHDYNIGYAEIANLPNGILSADGINITADARGWARGESTASALEYNISSEAAAEYAASITPPDADVSLAAVTPGVTITPNDPAPIGGITVMAISYSDLAGLMSFKNVSTGQFLTLTHQPPISLTTRSGIVKAYSQWLVAYDAEYGLAISNLSDVYYTYLGFDDMDEFTIASLSPVEYPLTMRILSEADGIVNIRLDQRAISSTGALYEKSEDDDYFPESCEWEITNKEDCTLVSSINPNSSTRVEQSEIPFFAEYTVNPTNATHYDIGLYDASDNSLFESEGSYDFTDPGVYTVYYKDKYTRVRSGNFLLIVVDSFEIYDDNITYSIQPVSAPNRFLTMEMYYELDNSNNKVYNYNATSNILQVSPITYSKISYKSYQNLPEDQKNSAERWDVLSRTFTIEPIDNNYYYISATLSTKQYDYPIDDDITDEEFTDEYYLTSSYEQPNYVNYFDSTLSTKFRNDAGSKMIVAKIDFAYYIICDVLFENGTPTPLALKYDDNNQNISVDILDTTKEEFRWCITKVGVDAPLIKQTRDYFCGYTTLLQVLYGAKIPVTVNETRLETNENESDLDAQIKAVLWSIGDGIKSEADQNFIHSDLTNHYLPDDIECKKESNLTDQQVAASIQTSLNLGYAAFITTTRGRSPYVYGATGTTRHYLAIVAIQYSEDGNSDNDFVVISNCHYHDDVFGIYAVQLSDFCTSIEYLYFCTSKTNS